MMAAEAGEGSVSGPDRPPLAVGADLTSISRIGRLVSLYGERFTARVYTAGELAACGGRTECLAARWAAKEAVAKALGTGICPTARFTKIEVLRGERGRPILRLHGATAEAAAACGLRDWAISLSHEGDLALAFVVATARS